MANIPPHVRQVVLDAGLFKSIAATETPRAVAAIIHFDFKERFRSERAGHAKLVLVLDRIRDPGNMGTIIRTAAAAGVELIYYTSGSADPYSPKVLRATAGAIFAVQVEEARKPLNLIRDLKQEGLQLVAAAARSGCSYWSVDYGMPTALLIGSEADGIAEELSAEADYIVSIPLGGPVESLNAAVASAVIIYEIIRCRRT